MVNEKKGALRKTTVVVYERYEVDDSEAFAGARNQLAQDPSAVRRFLEEQGQEVNDVRVMRREGGDSSERVARLDVYHEVFPNRSTWIIFA
jgi:hypothetical protein